MRNCRGRSPGGYPQVVPRRHWSRSEVGVRFERLLGEDKSDTPPQSGREVKIDMTWSIHRQAICVVAVGH